jgi:anti-anti-sigma factor
MDEIEIRIDEAPSGIQVLHVTGPLTVKTVFDFQQVARTERPKIGRIVVLSGVPYMDSAGLGALLEAFASAQRHQLRFAVADVSPRLLNVLKVARVDSLVPHFESVEAAHLHVAPNAEGR